MLISTEMIVTRVRRVMGGHADPIARATASGARAVAMPVVETVPTNIAAISTAPAVVAATEAGEPITMPFGDLTVSEGRLIKWYRRAGESISAGEHVADIETDKAVVEIESPRSGILAQILAEEGATVPMGASIGIVREKF
jgi:2-oxoisovalerate dehydrogenase E1 component